MLEPRAQVAELVKSALERERTDWPQFFENECPAELRAEVESLLSYQADAAQLIETPAAHLAARMIAMPSTIAPGERIQQYEVQSLLGLGGMGEVYLAIDTELKRKVALKLVQRGMNTQSILRRFHHEEEILAALNDPNIAQLYGGGVTDDETPFFAMEYVEGERIDDFCQHRKLGLRERLELFRKVCSAVSYAHQRLIIHRDLKPANIRVNANGEPKLLDFGIAKLVDTATSTFDLTVTIERLMTPEYASPEQVRGEQITTASDVYSLGIILYELLTGTKPYRLKTRTADELSHAIIEQEVLRPSLVAAGRDSHARSYPRQVLRGDLDNIVLMALRKEPQRRYTSVAQLDDDLCRYLEQRPVIARGDSVTYRTSKFIRRNRLAVGAAAVVAASIIAGLIVAIFEARLAQQQRDAAQRERAKAERINQFLQRMLSFSNQSIMSVLPLPQRRDVTVNEMLDHVTPQVEKELADQPDVQAQVLRTIGSAYASQGQYNSAEKYLREAVGLQAQFYGPQSAEGAWTMVELGVLLLREFKLEEASRLLGDAVSFYRQQREGRSSDYSAAKLALALDYLAVTKFYRGDTSAAGFLMEEALQTSSNAKLEPTELVVRAFNKGDTGALLVNMGDLDRGEALIRAALDEYRQISPDPRWEQGVTTGYLGIVSMRRNRLDDAGKYLLEAERILRQTIGDHNFYLASCLNQQATLLLRRNQLQDAEKRAFESLRMTQESVPDNRLLWAAPMQTLGAILMKTDRVREGEDYYRQALVAYQEQPTRNYNLIVMLKVRFSQALQALHRTPEATQVASEAVKEAEQHFGADSALAKTASDNLAAIK